MTLLDLGIVVVQKLWWAPVIMLTLKGALVLAVKWKKFRE